MASKEAFMLKLEL